MPEQQQKPRRRSSNTADMQKADRLPPHSDEAEAAVIGACLMEPASCIPEAREVLTAGPLCFYDIRHQTIWENLCEVFDDTAGKFDLIILMQHMKDFCVLDSAGGLAYLASVQGQGVPGLLKHYLDIVVEKFHARKMVQTCTGIVGRIYDREGEIAEVLDEAESEVLKVREGRKVKGQMKIGELVDDFINRTEVAHTTGGATVGLSTGFPDLDRLTGGFKGGEMIVIAGRPGTGKAQPIDEPVLTPLGFVPIGSLRVGDYVVGLDGKPNQILDIHPQGKMQAYKVAFSDGTWTRCAAGHLWLTQTRNERRCHAQKPAWSVKTIEQIAATINRADGGLRNHILPHYEPIQFISTQPLPIHPWLMGALLGDGSFMDGQFYFCKPELDILNRVISLLPANDSGRLVFDKRAGVINTVSIHGSVTKNLLKSMGLWGLYSEEKFIPTQYLLASVAERWALLSGLIDTDGSVDGFGVDFSVSSKRLFDDFVFLARSLGLDVSTNSRIPKFKYKGETKNGLRSYRAHIRGSWKMISSMKHLSRAKTTNRHAHRSVVSVEQCDPCECACVTVENMDGLYLTRDFIPTHNSSSALNIVDHVAVELKLPVGIFSLEMTAASMIDRMICSRSKVNLRRVYSGDLIERDFPAMMLASGKIRSAPIYIDENSGVAIETLRAKAYRMFQQYGIKLLVIDYLQLLDVMKPSSSRQQDLEKISHGVKGLAKDLGIPIIALAQLNRESDKRKGSDARPRMSDLRDSGSIENDADLVGMLYKNNSAESNEEDPMVVPVNLDIVKQRSGPTGTVPLVFLKEYTRFESAAKIDTNDMPPVED